MSEYAGVALVEILKLAGVPLGQKLRGQALMTYLIADSADGYQVVFSLAELDPSFSEQMILLADSQDNKPLFGQTGPLQLILPQEKVHARWVRQMKSLTVKQARLK